MRDATSWRLAITLSCNYQNLHVRCKVSSSSMSTDQCTVDSAIAYFTENLYRSLQFRSGCTRTTTCKPEQAAACRQISALWILPLLILLRTCIAASSSAQAAPEPQRANLTGLSDPSF
ncbi:hypothetical protein J6590_002510 [Homalodisca vitripennis]|nr:hypothetical protein J6590_002510 [Homalodisca vitripennis]